MNQSADEIAQTILKDKKAYILAKVTQHGNDELLENIVIDGACIRTPEEDIIWAEQQKLLAEEAAKGAKGGKGAVKKKWLIINFKNEQTSLSTKV